MRDAIVSNTCMLMPSIRMHVIVSKTIKADRLVFGTGDFCALCLLICFKVNVIMYIQNCVIQS